MRSCASDRVLILGLGVNSLPFIATVVSKNPNNNHFEDSVIGFSPKDVMSKILSPLEKESWETLPTLNPKAEQVLARVRPIGPVGFARLAVDGCKPYSDSSPLPTRMTSQKTSRTILMVLEMVGMN